MPLPETLIARGGLPQLADRLSALGARRVLVICGPSRRFVDTVTAALAELSPTVFAEARVHVPAEVVAKAAVALRESGSDAILAIGGGSAIGLGKALRLEHDVRFAAVPTTYAGSEATTMYGITRDGDKQTGRDRRVAPDLVLYDPTLLRELSPTHTTQSLLNSLAHVASVASTGTTDLAPARELMRAIEDLMLHPRALTAREHAARAAAACAALFETGKAGAQHAIAHLLGGALGLEHAPLHAVLLPHFLAHLRAQAPEVLARLEAAVDRPDLDAYVHDLLVRAGGPVSLAELGVTFDSLTAALATRPDLPAAIARDALSGLRPPGRGGRITLGDAEALVLGSPNQAKRIVLALHGRGAEAGTIARKFRELVAHDPETTVIGLRAPGNGERWYGVKYGQPGAGADAEVGFTLGYVDRAVTALLQLAPRAQLTLAGFSQGACLALEYVARHGAKHGAALTGLLAPCGARIGRPSEWAAAQAGTLPHLSVMIGAAAEDPFIAAGDVDATCAWFTAAGARVEVVTSAGSAHEITARHRLRGRALVLGPQPPGGILGVLESEARPGAVPPRQNTPRRAPFGLYPEQVNGTPFTVGRAHNRRTWLYRVRPPGQRRPFTPLGSAHRVTGVFDRAPIIELAGVPPLPLPPPGETDFVDGLVTLCGAGDARLRRGFALHRYAATRSMNHRAMYSADGELLVLPDHGALTLLTELGPLDVAPGMLAVIPRGVMFSVLLREPTARGYIAEPFGPGFRLPERGPIGANGLVDPRHLRAPSAWFEDRLAPDFRVVGKLGGVLHEASQDHSPFDVVGWHGDHLPYVYDLAAFSPVGNTAFDHSDPSVFTALSAPLDEPGANTLDLVVFPPRWDATHHTFRAPFFHRNAVTEINGIILEPDRDAFAANAVFFTPPFTPHGVSGVVVDKIRAMTDAEADAPAHVTGRLWFQLETALPVSLTPWAESLEDWPATWGSHRSYFD